MMRTRLRGAVLVVTCLLVVIALRKKLAFEKSEDVFVNQEVVKAQEIQTPTDDPKQGAESIVPQPQEWKTYLEGSDDPEIIYKKYLLATYLYKKHDSLEALPLAISYATQLGRFDEASLLLKELPDIATLKDTLEVPVLMKLLMNTSDLSFAQLKQLKDFVETLKKQGSIKDAEYNFYYFVITLIKGDINNAQFYLSGMQTGLYHQQYLKIRSLEQATKEYGSSPPYYLRAVWAMFLYQQGWWGPARSIGQQIRQEDPTYLLAEQLIAYSSIALQDWKGASLSLQQLQKVDPSYRDVYQFFQAIAHYSLHDYETSISLFQQIPTTSTYYPDVVRYLYLSYVALNDEEKIGMFIDQLVSGHTLQDADVYTLFDSLLFTYPQTTGFVVYERFAPAIKLLEERCQKELAEKAYICLYGKGGILLAEGQKEKAYQILRRIINRYPRVSLFTLLGDLASDVSSAQEAEERYRRAFVLQQENLHLGNANVPQLGLQ